MGVQVHGTAHWTYGNHDLSAFFDPDNYKGIGGIILGNGDVPGQGVFWNTKHDQGHALCIAPNGTGKGASVIIPALLTYGGISSGSVFCIDPKGENAWVTADHRRRMESRVVLLDPFNEVNRIYGQGEAVEHPDRFNPLSVLDPSARSFADDVAYISDAIIITTAGENPHWPDSAREFVGGIVALVKEQFGDGATMRHVRRLITGDPDVLKDLAAAAETANPDSLGARKLRRFFREGSEEINNVRSTAETQTAFLDSEDLLESMEPDESGDMFDLRSFTSSKVTLYVVLPPAKLATHARWLRLMLSLTLRAVATADRPPSIPHLMIVDEMGTIGSLRPLEQGFGLLRGYGVRFFGFLQTLGQLKGDYPKTWENFIGNCSYLQCLGARDMETAKYISEMLGTTTVTKYKTVAANDYGGRMEQEDRQEGKPLLFPQQIMQQVGASPNRLDQNGQIIIKLQGGENYFVKQNPYFMQYRWNGWYRPIPWLSKGPAPAPVVIANPVKVKGKSRPWVRGGLAIIAGFYALCGIMSGWSQQAIDNYTWAAFWAVACLIVWGGSIFFGRKKKA